LDFRKEKQAILELQNFDSYTPLTPTAIDYISKRKNIKEKAEI